MNRKRFKNITYFDLVPSHTIKNLVPLQSHIAHTLIQIKIKKKLLLFYFSNKFQTCKTMSKKESWFICEIFVGFADGNVEFIEF